MWLVEKHTADAKYCWRVRNDATGETIGHGLLLDDAELMAARLNEG